MLNIMKNAKFLSLVNEVVMRTFRIARISLHAQFLNLIEYMYYCSLRLIINASKTTNIMEYELQ